MKKSYIMFLFLVVFCFIFSVPAHATTKITRQECQSKRNSWLSAKKKVISTGKSLSSAKKKLDAAKKTYNKKKNNKNKKTYNSAKKTYNKAQQNLNNAKKNAKSTENNYFKTAIQILKEAEFIEHDCTLKEMSPNGYQKASFIKKGQKLRFDLWLNCIKSEQVENPISEYFPAKFSWKITNSANNSLSMKSKSSNESADFLCTKNNAQAKKATISVTITADGKTIGTKTLSLDCVSNNEWIQRSLARMRLANDDFDYEEVNGKKIPTLKGGRKNTFSLWTHDEWDEYVEKAEWKIISDPENLLTIISGDKTNNLKLSCKSFSAKATGSVLKPRKVTTQVSCSVIKDGKKVATQIFDIICLSNAYQLSY